MLYQSLDKRFYDKTGFQIKDISFYRISDYLYRPSDPSSLAVTRILFGLAMLFDIPDERGGSQLEERWGNPRMCHFPLFPFIRAVPMPYMTLVYAAMWLGAMGIMLGYKFRASATIFAVCYWYLFVIEKSFWNNHSYLFALVALLLAGTSAHHYLSVDAYLNMTLQNTPVPYWNYFLLKYQFFILYFVAGLKKGTAEWLTGYSLLSLSEHWVFDPFKLFLSVPQIDYLIVHWFAFIFDLTVAFWMMWGRSRNIAMIFCAAFHLMNIRLFKIGMFPWVCLATMPLFYPSDWPKKAVNYIRNSANFINKYCKTLIYVHNDKENDNDEYDANVSAESAVEDVFMETSDKCGDLTEEVEDNRNNPSGEKNENYTRYEKNGRKWSTWLIILYVLVQAFLPYSHFITKGYNNWTKGLYGYSWDMMVHTWNSVSVTVRVVDNERNREYFLNPDSWTPNDRWARHGDMVYQFAHCMELNIDSYGENVGGDNVLSDNNSKSITKNVSIYIDVWCSMNGRFQQRMFDPKIDLLKAEWSLFEEVKWLMPLLIEAEHWRHTMDEIRDDVHSWSERSAVLFVADFPGYYLENYVPTSLDNMTLTILEGVVGFEAEQAQQSYIVKSGDRTRIVNGAFHKIHVLSEKPSYYMYTYFNTSLSTVNENRTKGKLPVGKEFTGRLVNMVKFFNLVIDTLHQMFFRLPVSRK